MEALTPQEIKDFAQQTIYRLQRHLHAFQVMEFYGCTARDADAITRAALLALVATTVDMNV